MTKAGPLTIAICGMKIPPETFLDRLVRGLIERGHRLLVCTHDAPRVAWSRSVEWVPLEPRQSLRRLGWWTRLALLAGPASFVRGWRKRDRLALQVTARRLHELRCDVLYYPWNSSAVSLAPLASTGIPFVVSCRGSQINVAQTNSDRAAFFHEVTGSLKSASLVHCVSDALAQTVSELGVSPQSIRVIRPAVDTTTFVPGGTSSSVDTSRLRILTSGSLIWRKGLEFLLTAVAIAVKNGVDAQLTLIGDGPEEQRVRFTIRDLGLDGRVVMTGKLSEGDVLSFLQRSDCFAQASLSEGISNATIEAMACALPVVVTDIPGIRELVEPDVTGFLTPVREPEPMAKCLAWISTNREAARTVGAAARRRIVEAFDIQRQLDGYEQLFKDARDRRSPA